MTEPALKILKLSKSVGNKTVEGEINTESEHEAVAPTIFFCKFTPRKKRSY